MSVLQHAKEQSQHVELKIDVPPNHQSSSRAVEIGISPFFLSMRCRYRLTNGGPTRGIPRSTIIRASGFPLLSVTTSYDPSCLRWLGHRSRAQRMLIWFNRGLYLRIRRAVESIVSSMYLWPLVSEKRLRWGRRWSCFDNCFKGFYSIMLDTFDLGRQIDYLQQ